MTLIGAFSVIVKTNGLFQALVSVPVEQLGRGLVDEPRLAVVVPGGHAPQARVGAQQRQRRREVLEEVGRNLQVVLNDDHLNIFSMSIKYFPRNIFLHSHLIEAHLHEGVVECPAIMTRDFEVSFCQFYYYQFHSIQYSMHNMRIGVKKPY